MKKVLMIVVAATMAAFITPSASKAQMAVNGTFAQSMWREMDARNGLKAKAEVKTDANGNKVKHTPTYKKLKNKPLR